MSKVPFRTSPMLATLPDGPFTKSNWMFEEKYDGVRILAYKEGVAVSLISRSEPELRNGSDDSLRRPGGFVNLAVAQKRQGMSYRQHRDG